MKVESNYHGISKILALLSITGVLLFSGCSTTTNPSTSLPFARSELEASREDGLSEYASLEVKIARDKVEEAEQATKMEEHEKAERLSQQALANLKLAEAKAEAKKAENIANELERNISTLRNEINR